MSRLDNDVHLTRDEWAEYLDYQAQHLTPKQVESLQRWADEGRSDGSVREAYAAYAQELGADLLDLLDDPHDHCGPECCG